MILCGFKRLEVTNLGPPAYMPQFKDAPVEVQAKGLAELKEKLGERRGQTYPDDWPEKARYMHKGK